MVIEDYYGKEFFLTDQEIKYLLENYDAKTEDLDAICEASAKFECYADRNEQFDFVEKVTIDWVVGQKKDGQPHQTLGEIFANNFIDMFDTRLTTEQESSIEDFARGI